MEVSGAGGPLRMARTLRYANRHQRRALLARDGGCIFPGCDRPPSWRDAHHDDEWDDRGPPHHPTRNPVSGQALTTFGHPKGRPAKGGSPGEIALTQVANRRHP